MSRLQAAALALGATMLVALPAKAQSAAQGATGNDGLKGYVALGAGMIPDYEGSQNYEATPYFEGRVNKGNYYLRFEGGDLRANLLDSDSIHVGPLIGFRRGRGDVADWRVTRLHHIDDSLTAGGFFELENVHQDPRAAERLTVTAADDVTGQDSGWDVTLRGVVRRPFDFIDRGLIASFEADTDWASQNYMQTYFDVTPADHLRSGLLAFGAKAGFKSIGTGISFDQFLSRKWSVGMRFHYARLLNSAADSPVTHIEGVPDQYFVGLVVGYVL